MRPQEFASKMRECRESGDTEGAHYDADQLLVAMLRSLAPMVEHLPEDADALAAGLDDYGLVGKWYA